MKINNVGTAAIVISVIGALATAGIIIFLTVPSWTASVHYAEQLTETESQIQAQYANRQKLSATVEQAKSAAAVRNELLSQFLPIGRELDLITAVEAIGDKRSVGTKFRVDPPDKQAALSDYGRGFSLSLTGSYQAVVSTLIDFESLRYLSTLDSLTLTSGGGPNAVVTMDIRGRIASPPIL